MKHQKIEPYEALKEIAPNLYCIDGDWENTTFRRRMTVIRLKSGGVVVHSAIRLKEEDYVWIDRLGPVECIIVPNTLHTSEYPYYATRYPKARVLKSPGAEQGYPGELEFFPFLGTRMLKETVLYHVPTRTLVTTDLVFNMQVEVKGFEKKFFEWNKIYKRFGPSKIFRYVFMNDKKAAAQSLHRILEWDIQRVIMGHGQILETGGREALRKGFAEIGISG